jgi:hypothetical protein
MNVRQEALAYAYELGRNFPFLRPAGAAQRAFAERAADELFGLDGEVPDAVLAKGVTLLGESDRAALVDAYAHRFPDVWAALRADIGDETAACALVESAVRASVDELREPWPAMVEAFEPPDVPDLPYHALACVLTHDAVWSLDDALAAAAEAAPVERRRDAWEHAIARVVEARLEAEHLARIRRLAGRLETWLPFAGLPRASDLLARACELAARDRRTVLGRRRLTPRQLRRLPRRPAWGSRGQLKLAKKRLFR